MVFDDWGQECLFERVRKRAISRERLINEVSIGIIGGEQVANRVAGMGSREQDLAGELLISSVTCLLVRGVKADREDVARHSRKRASRLDNSFRPERESWIFDIFCGKKVARSLARATGESW